MRIRGRESLKTQITRTICRKVSEISGKKVDYSRPDLTVLVPLNDDPVAITPRSIWISARYLKTERGIPQRDKTCPVCNGLGCATCDFKGSSANSVQSIASETFTKMFQAEKCNFIWIGGEDDNSLVLGSGRQFFVEVVKPRKRTYIASLVPESSTTHGSSIDDGVGLQQPIPQKNGVEFRAIEILKFKPTRIPMFKMDCEVYLDKLAESGDESLIDAGTISAVEKEFRGIRVSVQVSRRFKRVSKFIESIELTKRDDMGLTLRIKCDGGIPIKKLVGTSDDSVIPNLSSYLKNYKIDESRPFDVLDVILVKDEAPVHVLQRGKDRQFRRGHRRERYNRPSDSSLENDSIDEQSELLEAMS